MPWPQASAEIGLVLGDLGAGDWAPSGPSRPGAPGGRGIRASSPTAILVVIYMGYLAMRRFVEDPEKRATWAAVMGIFGFVDIPVLWFSVRWWRVDAPGAVEHPDDRPDDAHGVDWSAAMFLALTVVWLYQRFLLAQAAQKHEVALPSTLPDAQEA